MDDEKFGWWLKWFGDVGQKCLEGGENYNILQKDYKDKHLFWNVL